MAGCEVTDLREILRTERILPNERALALIAGTGAALDAARTAGVVVRALNPSRIQVARDSRGHERVRVSRDATAAGVDLSEMIGYAPPEQLSDDGGERHDAVYSLACVLYECLAGETPFSRRTEVASVFAHLNDPPPNLSALRPDLPRALDAVFVKALAKDPRERYRDCTELSAAARAALCQSRRRRRRVVTLAFAVSVLILACKVKPVTTT